MTDLTPLLTRIADALDRIAPPPAPPVDPRAYRAYRWDGAQLHVETGFAPADFAMLTGIDAQKQACLMNTRRLAEGYAAHDVLLWGARGTGKSATVAAVVGEIAREGHDIALIDCPSALVGSLPALFDILDGLDRAFVVYIDDLGFDGDFAQDARALRSVLQGAAHARGSRVRVYATSNRRHIVPRSLSEQDDPINPRDVVDDRLALADRFGLSLGFHAITQDDYVAIVATYAAHHGLSFDPKDSIQWATQRGSRSGRVAWQYVVELAGRAGRAI